MNMVQHVTGGVVALPWAGYGHTARRVNAAVIRLIQLPAKLTADGQREVGLLLSRLIRTVNSFFGFTGEGGWFPVGAVVMVIALNAISGQATTQPPTGTLGSVALITTR